MAYDVKSSPKARHLQALPDPPAPGFPSLTEGEPAQILRYIGCDRLSVSFPVAGFEPDETAWNSLSVSNPGSDRAAETRTGSVTVNDTKCMVGVAFIPGTQKWWGKVEFNPSRVVDPDGWGVASFDQSLDALGSVIEEAAGELVAPAIGELDEMRVTRVDVTRDFNVPRPDFFMTGLGPVPRPWARRNLLHFDPRRKGAQTLMVGSGAGVVRLYDKHAETDGRAPVGALRWEAECKKGWAENYGDIRAVRDLRDAEKVGTLALNRWEWSGMGIQVSARQRVIEEVMRSALSPREQVSFLGWLVMHAEGIPSGASARTLDKYRRLVRELGVTLGPETLEEGTKAIRGQFTARLDFATGLEVLCA